MRDKSIMKEKKELYGNNVSIGSKKVFTLDLNRLKQNVADAISRAKCLHK